MNQNKILRTDISFLKGIAIIAVVLYHLFNLLNSDHITNNILLFEGGYIGVDIFFVISGFFITKGIVSDLDNGKFSFISFFKKRFLRIYFPFVLMALAVLAVGYYLLFPYVYKELAQEAINVSITTANTEFAKNGGYFSLNNSDKLLLHGWYLCITLKFYIIIPLLLFVFYKAGGKKYLCYWILLSLIVTLVIAFKQQSKDSAYLLTKARIWELFFGAAVFAFNEKINLFINKLGKKAPLYIELFCIVCILLLIFTQSLKNGCWRIVDSLPAVIAASLIICANNPKSILKNKAVCYIGDSSYSLYLWHWPLFILLLKFDYPNLAAAIFAVALITLSISYVSYRYVEKLKNISIVTVMLLIVLMSLGHFIVKNDGENYMTNHMKSGFSAMVLDDVKRSDEFKASTVLSNDNFKVEHLGSQTETPHIFFVGDSNEEHYVYYLKNINEIPVYSMYIEATMAYGRIFTNMEEFLLVGLKERQIFNTMYNQMLNMLTNGDKVVLCNLWGAYYQVYLMHNSLEDSKENFAEYIKAMISDIEESVTAHPDLKFNLVSNAIMLSNKTINCLKADYSDSFLKHLINVDRCRLTADESKNKNDAINNALLELALKYDNVNYIDRNKLLRVDADFYKTTDEDGKSYFFDHGHFSSYGGSVIGAYLLDEIK